MFLFQKIEELSVAPNTSASSIASYILEDRSRILKKSLQEVAQETYTSKASVVRFAKSLGYSGWKEFLKDYLVELNYQNQFKGAVDFNFPFKANSSVEEIAESLRTLAIQSIDDTLENLDKEALVRIVNLMHRANRIVIFCVSPHTYSAQLFKRKMMTIQKPVTVVATREMGITARSMNSKDFALIISYSGENQESEPMNVISYLKENNIPVAAITSSGKNYIRSQIDTVLSITTMESLYNKIATFSTEESLQYLLNLIYSCYFARSYDMHKANKTESAKILEQKRHHTSAIKE